MNFLNSIFGVKAKQDIGQSEYHNYPDSSTEDQKRIDSIITFKNAIGLQQLAQHGITLTTGQVYRTMLGEGSNSFIYSFNSDLMIYFLNNNEKSIRTVLENMCQEIYTELNKSGFVEMKGGFAIAPKASEIYYEKLKYLGNFLSNDGFSGVVIKDSKYANRMCECLSSITQKIHSDIEAGFANNRAIKSSTNGILEEIQHYIEYSLGATISKIFSKAQQSDVEVILSGLIGGQHTMQKNRIMEMLAEMVKNFDLTNLPQEAQELYSDIKSLIVELEPHRDDMQDEAQLMFSKLTDERLPEILQQYIVLPKNFLKIYEGKADSPQNMVIATLTSLKMALVEIHTSFFTKKVLDLKVTQNYMEQIARATS